MRGSRFIHLNTTDSNSFFLWLGDISLYICITSSLSIHLLMEICFLLFIWFSAVFVFQFSSVAQFSSVQLLSRVRLFVTPWITARQASLPSPTPGVHSNSCPLSRWCHPAISSSVVPFSSWRKSFPASCKLTLFQWVSSSHQVVKVLELQNQSFQWIFRTDLL